MPVVDASVVVSALTATDTNHVTAARWLANAIRSGIAMRAPSILLPEVTGAVRRATGREDLAEIALQELLSLPRLTMYPVSLSLALRASAAARNHGLRGCDAVYLALAAEHGDTLITLDREQLQRGAAVALTATP